MLKALLRLVLVNLLLVCCFNNNVKAQSSVAIADSISQHIFSFGEIQSFEDASNKLSINDIDKPQYADKFTASVASTPTTIDTSSAYWYRIRIKQNLDTKNNWLLEFFDQTIDNITVYSPNDKGGYSAIALGSARPFGARLYQHKNFSLNINNNSNSIKTYYIRVKSHQQVNVIVVLRSVNWFVHYALDEYFFFGIFYGMLLVFSLYNLMMFFAIRQKQYLLYVMYNLSIGMYEMCADGIAYQYIWPTASIWNQYAYGIFLFLASVFGLMFTQNLLYIRAKAPKINQIMWSVIIARCMFFLACLLINKAWFNYKIVEIIPLLTACYAGYFVLNKGYWPARFFVVGYSFLFLGFIIKLLIAFNVPWLPFGPVTHYSLSVCFIMEMLFISFAIGEKVRILKKNKDHAQRRIIAQMKQNEELKDVLNKELESQVLARTKEVVEKSITIEQQNDELKQVNFLLQQQAEEISRMNVLLEQDNIELHTNIEKVTHDRVMNTEVDFEEFNKIYPDRETCFKFLAELKWDKGYECRKCHNTHFSLGHTPYSRRCTKCGYQESVIYNTIFQNTRIPINKAFYMIFLMYSTKGKISSHKLSEILSIRQSTCWAYSARIKKIMEERKKELRNAGHKGWSKLVIDVSEDEE